jgi:predicted dehydrogenase
MEAEDVVNSLLWYENGATGVLQAATAFWPGFSERIELHGTKGSAVITGDKLTFWQAQDDSGEPAPVETAGDSGAADPMAISIENLKRQFVDFGAAVREGRAPSIDGEEGYRALQIVLGVYEAARSGATVTLS